MKKPDFTDAQAEWILSNVTKWGNDFLNDTADKWYENMLSKNTEENMEGEHYFFYELTELIKKITGREYEFGYNEYRH